MVLDGGDAVPTITVRSIVLDSAFMADQLGIELHPDVLPLSNLAAHLPPFLLRPDRAMTMRP